MVLNFYHKVAAQALQFRLRHIDGDVTLGASSRGRTAARRNYAAPALDKAWGPRL
jgi:hypothetical protein